MQYAIKHQSLMICIVVSNVSNALTTLHLFMFYCIYVDNDLLAIVKKITFNINNIQISHSKYCYTLFNKQQSKIILIFDRYFWI